MMFVTLIVSIMAGVLFYSIGIKFFLLFAVFIAVMNLIPYVGVLISSFLVVLYVLLTTDSVFYPLFTLVMLWIMQGVENNIITPFVVGTKVKVNALAVVIAILAGGALWGVSGMILFIPIVGVLKISLDRTPGLEPYGYLLGDNVPVLETKENFWKILLKKLNKKV
jgi:predicted PurR-regulated permease PerM